MQPPRHRLGAACAQPGEHALSALQGWDCSAGFTVGLESRSSCADFTESEWQCFMGGDIRAALE